MLPILVANICAQVIVPGHLREGERDTVPGVSNIIMSRLKQRVIISSALTRNSPLTSGHYSSTNSEARPDEPACLPHSPGDMEKHAPSPPFIHSFSKHAKGKRRKEREKNYKSLISVICRDSIA